MKPTLYYCYDAYCGWCYGFSPVIKKIFNDYQDRLRFEVLSGGMIPAENPRHISAMASFIKEGHKRVEEMTGVKFGPDFLWHIFNSDKSDWYPHSEKSAIAMCIFKELLPDKQVLIATDIQYALNFEGRDLTDDEAYRHLAEKYGVDAGEFYSKLKSPEYRDKAAYEFQLCRQLQVTGFPAVLLQESDTKFYLVARGFTSYENISARLENIFAEIGNKRDKTE